MGRDWSKARRRDQVRLVYDYEAELARALSEFVPPTKEQLRLQARQAVKDFFAANRRVTKLPTVLHLQCPRCRHRGSVQIPPGKAMPRFKCRRCGTRL